MRRFIQNIQDFIKNRFNLEQDREDEKLIIQAVQRDVEFRGASLWALVFAIFIASIGLNTNSVPVIIGAMLISPLMGPIMGIGLSVGINDFDLLKRGIKNLLIASLISIIASGLYFSVTPLKEVTPALLARTNPSLWDVFIAFFGGLAGIVAGTRKEKGNVIPGVAIATALMPPLCTVGYGLATQRWFFALGALYLYFINSLMICFGTFLIVKQLRFHRKKLASAQQEKRVGRYIMFIVLITVLPSIYLALRIVDRSVFEGNAKKFVEQEFHFRNTEVVSRKFNYDGKGKEVEVLLMGKLLSDSLIQSLDAKMPAYGLKNTRLVVHQGLDAKKEIDLSQIKASILEEVFSAESKTDTLSRDTSAPPQTPDISKELKALYPSLRSYSIDNHIVNYMDSTRKDTVTVFTGTFSTRIPAKDQERLAAWLKERTGADSIQVVLKRAAP